MGEEREAEAAKDAGAAARRHGHADHEHNPPRRVEPVFERVQRIVYAVGILFPVLAFGVGRAWGPPVKDDAAAQIAYSAAHPALHVFEVVVFPLVCVLSLLGVIGLTRLAIHRSPWWAATGGVLALAGWGTLPIWAGQDNLTWLMGRTGATSPQMVELWNQFNTSGTGTYLYIFILGHLFGPLLLGVALVRARVVPTWVPIAVAVSIPLHVLAFVTGASYVDPIAYALLAAALVPAAAAVLRPSRPTPAPA
ncbi:hypothetical protein [Specibacter cremeus]|uniref:hypothetical protein n=1 Tax=Specibacter cremeus TaxID=1629051 RepID=UPI000F7A9E31|nr:hypothetical protein [Specibacter cremeus]